MKQSPAGHGAGCWVAEDKLSKMSIGMKNVKFNCEDLSCLLTIDNKMRENREEVGTELNKRNLRLTASLRMLLPQLILNVWRFINLTVST